jgi:hypothetical protein
MNDFSQSTIAANNEPINDNVDKLIEEEFQRMF